MERPRFFLDSVREVVANCRSMCRAPVILGGAGYSIFPESALRYLGADMGIQGEGEVVFLLLWWNEWLTVLRFRGFPGIYLPGMLGCWQELRKNPGNDLPLPDPGLLIPPHAGSRNLWVPVQSRRGCPKDCTFCSTSTIEGRPIRRRSPDRIVRWLTDLREIGYRNFNFVDNTFTLSLILLLSALPQDHTGGTRHSAVVHHIPEVDRCGACGSHGESRVPPGQPGV